MNWYVRSALFIIALYAVGIVVTIVFGYLATPEGLRP